MFWCKISNELRGSAIKCSTPSSDKKFLEINILLKHFILVKDIDLITLPNILNFFYFDCKLPNKPFDPSSNSSVHYLNLFCSFSKLEIYFYEFFLKLYSNSSLIELSLEFLSEKDSFFIPPTILKSFDSWLLNKS